MISQTSEFNSNTKNTVPSGRKSILDWAFKLNYVFEKRLKLQKWFFACNFYCSFLFNFIFNSHFHSFSFEVNHKEIRKFILSEKENHLKKFLLQKLNCSIYLDNCFFQMCSYFCAKSWLGSFEFFTRISESYKQIVLSMHFLKRWKVDRNLHKNAGIL